MSNIRLSRKEKLMKGWLSCWLYVICAIGGILVALLACNWDAWVMWKKLVALGDLALILHVMEEWKFPGGFFYMYNLQHGSTEELANRYPMSQQTDMFTNFIPIVYGLVILLVDAPYLTALPWFGLSIMEVIVHTLAGIQSKNRFKNKGKKTIYNPGFITTWFCFFPVLVGFIISFVVDRVPTIGEVLWAIVITVAMTKICIDGEEKTFKRKDTPYAYDWGYGYFEKFH